MFQPLKLHKKVFLGLAPLLSVGAVPAMAAEKTAVLEEVIVTATKREASLQDVPLAVSAFSGEVLNLARATEFQDLVQVSPSVTFTQTGDMRGVGVLVRGIGTTAFQTAVEPTVSTVVDGVTMGRTVQFLSDLNDIERVEVLRGPQGTLFGKNASAGLIHIITKRPAEQFEGAVEASVTDDDGWSVNTQLSGPISDTVRYRIAAYTNDFDGFIDNVQTGETLNGDESKGVRAKLEFDIGDNANLLLIGDYSEQDRDCCRATQIDLAGNRFYEFDYNAYNINVNDENDKSLGDGAQLSNTETAGLSAELNVNFENFVFTSITAYREFDLITMERDGDATPYSGLNYGRLILEVNDADQEQEQFSQEFRIRTTAWENLDLTAGLFYWDQEVDRRFDREVFLCVAPGAGDTSLSPDPALTPCVAGIHTLGFADILVESKNWAAFGQADWRFAENWTASLGLRYTEDELDFDFARTAILPGPLVPPSFSAKNSVEEDDISGKFSLQWDITPETMLYASYAEGYKAPAFDVIFALNGIDRTRPVPAETSKAWEAGVKSDLFDNRLRLALTGFYTEFEGLQGQALDPNAIAFLLTSAGSAITRGVELDFTAKPLPNLLINGGVAWVDAYFDEFNQLQCYPGQSEAQGCIGGLQDVSGEDIPNSPDLKFSLQARYDIVLEAPVDMFVSLSYRYQDESPGDNNQDPRLENDSYGITDLVIGVDSDNGQWSGRFFVKNLFDKFYYNTLQSNPLSGGVQQYLTRDYERYMGVEFQYRFGAY